MKQLQAYSFITVIMLAFLSCKKENMLDLVKSNGPQTTEVRHPGNFKTIEVFDKVFVNIYNGPEFKVEVLAGKHIIKNVTTRIKDDALIIRNDNTCNFVRGYKHEIVVNVTVPRIDKVTNSGVATVAFAQDFAQDTLAVRAQNSGDIYINGTYNQIRTSSHGNGDIYINGKCNSFFIYTNGTNYVNAENLIVTDYTFVETLSIGHCYINATQLTRFEYNIWSNGNIYYTGTPAYIVDYSNGKGKGRAIQK